MRHDAGSRPPDFRRLTFNAQQCQRDLVDLNTLLTAPTLDERAHILPFFKAHPHLSLFLGQYNLVVRQAWFKQLGGTSPLGPPGAWRAALAGRRPAVPGATAQSSLDRLLGITTPDILAYEMDLFGHFSADLVVGDWTRKKYCFVEFEDAKPDSIFKPTSRRTTRWSDRFEAAFSQIVDWTWLLAANEGSDMFERMFGARSIEASAIIVLGRDSGITAADRLRWEWRRRHIRVYSQIILCYTFDELARDLHDALNYGPYVPT